MDLQLLAAQLKKPDGEMGKQIGEVMNNGNRLINEWTLAALDLQEGDTILEIGMGNGFFIKDILATKPSLRYEGLDYSEIMIAAAQEINRSFIEEQRVHFTLGTAGNLPFEDGLYEKIFTINTIYFWDNAKNELNEIKRVLKQGGKFVIAIRSKETMKQMPFTEYGFVKYDQRELIALLEKNGFIITDVVQQKEPPYEFNGQVMQPENIIVSCTV
jgi:ubiquinone/menaquinone biosynthesis C-methylase UbiE